MKKTYSKYAITFDKTCPGWDIDKDVSEMYVKCNQLHLNDLLNRRGYVYLVEVYNYLNIKYDWRNGDLRKVGWLHNAITEIGDGFIDIQMDRKEDGSYILDFNVDGDITT